MLQTTLFHTHLQITLQIARQQQHDLRRFSRAFCKRAQGLQLAQRSGSWLYLL